MRAGIGVHILGCLAIDVDRSFESGDVFGRLVWLVATRVVLRPCHRRPVTSAAHARIAARFGGSWPSVSVTSRAWCSRLPAICGR